MRNKFILNLFFCFLFFSSVVYSTNDDGRISKDLLKAIVKIQTPIGQGATGFLISNQMKAKTDSSHLVFLVTNKHVVGDWNAADGDIQKYHDYLNVFLYLSNTTGQSPTKVYLKDSSGNLRAKKILIHPDAKVDVAIIDISEETTNEKFLDLSIFDVSYLLEFNRVMSWYTGLGDQVFALGYPAGITSLKNNYPIAKSGYLASPPGEEFSIDLPVKNRIGVTVMVRIEGKLMLIDGLIVGGNSGGPVVLPQELEIRRNPNTNQVEFATEMKKNFVIGMVSGGIGSSGLTICFSSDYILQLINKYLESIK